MSMRSMQAKYHACFCIVVSPFVLPHSMQSCDANYNYFIDGIESFAIIDENGNVVFTLDTVLSSEWCAKHFITIINLN